MMYHNAMLAIQELLDGTEWTHETLEQLAEIMRKAGYRIRDLNDNDASDGFASLAKSIEGMDTHPSPTAVEEYAAWLARQPGMEGRPTLTQAEIDKAMAGPQKPSGPTDTHTSSGTPRAPRS